MFAIALLVAAAQPLDEAKLAAALGGALDVIHNATRVEAQRLFKPGEKGDTVILSDALATRAKTLVATPKIYSPTNKCEFRPGLRLTFFHAEAHAALEFCFVCGEVWLEAPDRFLSFVGGFDRVLALARDIFSKDAALRKITRP
jgi:hypothetical protein